MGVCGFCGNEMQSGEGCIEHEVVVTRWQNDGRIDVIDSPRHDSQGSLVVNGFCGDCGVEIGEIHHPHCDNARRPDGTQLLIDSVEYRTDDQAIEGHNRLEEPIDGKAESYQFRAHPDIDFRGVSTHLSLDHELETDVHEIQVSCYIDEHKVDRVLSELPLGEWDVEDNRLTTGSRQLWFTKRVA